jgi:hypothetical protein
MDLLPLASLITPNQNTASLCLRVCVCVKKREIESENEGCMQYHKLQWWDSLGHEGDMYRLLVQFGGHLGCLANVAAVH